MERKETKQPKKMDFAVVGKFLVFLLGLHFLYFGYISNAYEKIPGDNLLFLYQGLFDFSHVPAWSQTPTWYFGWLALFVCVVFMAFSEDFLMVAMKKAIWTVPIVIANSLVWYWWNYYFYYMYDYYGPLFGGTNKMKFFQPLVSYFGSYKGYLNILIMFIIISGFAIFGGFLKILYRKRFKQRSAEEI